ncbi:MAG: hypothetical protein V7641_1101 [Blastocatellia bacterium]
MAKHITIDTDIHHGTPVITGTRVPVAIVVGSLAGGMTKEEVCHEYEISKEAVDSALVYAAELVATTEVIPLVGA